MKRKILVLSANPKDSRFPPLRLDEEMREIDRSLRRSQKRDQFDLTSRWAVTHRELQLAVLEENPQIVHFCGHGMGEQGLVLEDEAGLVKFVSTDALTGLFKLFADQVECVLLNACYSDVQATAISTHINHVIGMTEPIGDRAAVEFAFGFYSAIGNGKSYDFAYEFGCNSIRAAGISEADTPVLKQRSLQIILRESLPDNLPSLWIHGLHKQSYGDLPTVNIDWTQYFLQNGRRQVPDQSTWENKLFPNLDQAKQILTQFYSNECIDLRAKLPLPTMLAVGATFPELAYQLQYEQLVDGEAFLWKSNVPRSALRFQVVEEKGKVGKNLLMAFAIGGSAHADVLNLDQQSPGLFDALVYAEPETDAKDVPISNADAIALAIDAKKLMRLYRQKYSANCIHLVMLGPAGFALFVGQRLNTLGRIVGYDWVADSYQIAVKLQVGG